MATVSQLLDMNNTKLEWVTVHLEHTPNVQKTWYRQEAWTAELTKIAKLIIANDNKFQKLEEERYYSYPVFMYFFTHLI